MIYVIFSDFIQINIQSFCLSSNEEPHGHEILSAYGASWAKEKVGEMSINLC